jgi:membrane-bound lytic murein transglycosylase B
MLLAVVTLSTAAPAGASTRLALELDEAAQDRVVAPESAEPVEFTLAELLPDSQIYHPDVLRQVMPTSSTIDALRADLSTAMIDRDDAESRRLDALARRSQALREGWTQRVVVANRLEVEAAARRRSEAAFDDLGAFAVDSFLGSEEVDLARLSVAGPTSPLPGLTDGAGEVVEERYAAAKTALASSRLARIEAEDVAAAIADRVSTANADLQQAVADLDDAETRVADLRPRLEQALIGEKVPGTDLSLVVIDAYFRAAVAMSERRSACGISWDQLAGVGLIESRHGAFGGSSVGPDGQTSKEILGPVLDGEPFSAISDTDGGALDGNTEWDRAVGPMQFIPGSWDIYGLDGNDDGIADPHNLYDAAFSAAEHLCRGHSGLQRESAYRASLLGYNRSVVYGSDVIAAQRRYEAAVNLRPTEEGIAEDLRRRESALLQLDS